MDGTGRLQIIFQLGLAPPCRVEIGQTICFHAHEIESIALGTRYSPKTSESLFQLPMGPAFDRKTLPKRLMIFREPFTLQRNIKMDESVRAKSMENVIVKRNFALELSGGNDRIDLAALRGDFLLRPNVNFAHQEARSSQIRGPDEDVAALIEAQAKIYKYKFLASNLLTQQLDAFMAKQDVHEDCAEKKNRRER